jgi:aminoglycoside phosphotransferase (APT) family kinase protein
MTAVPAPAASIDFDPARLRVFLGTAMPALTGPMRVERIGGGQSNPTYFLTFDTAEVVLRKRPNGELPKSAHDVVREHRIIAALAGSEVPVPRALLCCADASIIGTPFYLMERLHGRIFHDARLPEVVAADRRSYYLEHARGLAALHRADLEATGLAGLARPGNFLARQVDRWAGAWEHHHRKEDAAYTGRWLRERLPVGQRQALVHGDFKFTNVVFDATAPRLIGVLDWELAAIGDPLLDLAHIWSAWWATTSKEYGGLLGTDLNAEGLPQAEEYIAAYATAAGIPGGLPPFYRVLALLRNAGIFLGIAQRAAAGTAAAANAAEQGQTADAYLDRAVALARESSLRHPAAQSRRGRKNSRTSVTNTSGISSAGKWPPRATGVQRRTLNAASARARGGAPIRTALAVEADSSPRACGDVSSRKPDGTSTRCPGASRTGASLLSLYSLLALLIVPVNQ